MAYEQPYDRLIKETLSNIDQAIIFFKNFLPDYIARNLDFSTLKLENKTFLNEAGRETFSDMVFSCHWRGSEKMVLLHFLLEHKSTPEQRPLLQILGYLAEGYQEQVKLQRKEKRNELLVPIIPVLLYHGEEEWNPSPYPDYFELPDPQLVKYLPNFEIIFVNLATFTDEKIIALGQCFLSSTLLVFKHKNDKGYILANIGKVFNFVLAVESPEMLSRFFRAFLLYLFRAFRFQKNELDMIVQDLPKITQPMFESTYDMLIKEGEIVGIQKGEAIGIQKGEAIGIQKGEAIGIQKGERLRSLDIVLDGIANMPSMQDIDLSRLSKLPLEFVSQMRKHYLKGDLLASQRTAAGLLADLPNVSDQDLITICTNVETVWGRLTQKKG